VTRQDIARARSAELTRLVREQHPGVDVEICVDGETLRFVVTAATPFVANRVAAGLAPLVHHCFGETLVEPAATEKRRFGWASCVSTRLS
jgi:hypothetical protein